mmetsp:Transcript_12046/g.43395  ORF Transcript_12046/g.43395 Transcript_12046/m.43395 type:complete len:493 (-) Transcript_12046:75-1553(-)
MAIRYYARRPPRRRSPMKEGSVRSRELDPLSRRALLQVVLPPARSHRVRGEHAPPVRARQRRKRHALAPAGLTPRAESKLHAHAAFARVLPRAHQVRRRIDHRLLLVAVPLRGAVPHVERVERHERVCYPRVRVVRRELRRAARHVVRVGELELVLLLLSPSRRKHRHHDRRGGERVLRRAAHHLPDRLLLRAHVVLRFAYLVVPLLRALVSGEEQTQRVFVHLPRRVERRPREPDVVVPVRVRAVLLLLRAKRRTSRHRGLHPPGLLVVDRVRVSVQATQRVVLGHREVRLRPALHEIDGAVLHVVADERDAGENLPAELRVALLRERLLEERPPSLERLRPQRVVPRVLVPHADRVPAVLHDAQQPQELRVGRIDERHESLRARGRDGGSRAVVHHDVHVDRRVLVRHRASARGVVARARARVRVRERGRGKLRRRRRRRRRGRDRCLSEIITTSASDRRGPRAADARRRVSRGRREARRGEERGRRHRG